MRPEVGRDEEVLAGEVEAAVEGADHPVDGDLDAQAGRVEAGPGLGADAGARGGRRARRRGGGSSRGAGCRPRASAWAARGSPGPVRRGDLERVGVGRQAEVGDDDRADRRGAARRPAAASAAGSSRAGAAGGERERHGEAGQEAHAHLPNRTELGRRSSASTSALTERAASRTSCSRSRVSRLMSESGPTEASAASASVGDRGRGWRPAPAGRSAAVVDRVGGAVGGGERGVEVVDRAALAQLGEQARAARRARRRGSAAPRPSPSLASRVSAVCEHAVSPR